MAVQDTYNSHRDLIISVGKAAASALFPSDFELYLTAI